jgi:fibronectin type 3 domain-containing protein
MPSVRVPRHRRRTLFLEPLEKRDLLSGLVAAYAFNEGSGTTVNDLSGNGNNGTLTNATWVAGKSASYGTALKFTGATNSFVSIPDASSLDLTNGMTLEAWVDPSSLSSPNFDWCAAVAKDHPNSSNDISYALYAATGTNTPPGEHILVGNNDVGVGATSKLSLNTWTFLAATYDGANLKIYVNGTLIKSQAQTGNIVEVNAPLKIGGDWSGEMFTGLIDDVRVYNTALTQSQIQTDMSTPLAPPDTIPPTVSMTAPANGSTVSGASVIVSANATDNVAVAKVQFQLDGANLGSAVTVAPYQVTWDSTAVKNGSHTLTAIATDTSGNSATSAAFTVTVNNPDTIPPTVSITAPAANASLSGTVTLSANASDNQAVAGVQFQIDGVNLGSQITVTPYSRTWDTTTAANGPHTITAIATDTSGNMASASISVTVSQGGDTTPPTVAITAPANNTTAAGAITFAANATDNVAVASVQFSVDGVNVGPALTAAPYQFNWNSTSLADGTHIVTATAVDTRGNKATNSVTLVTANGGLFGSVINTPANPVTGDPVVPMHAALLNNGKVLFYDGGPNCLGAISPTLWDPATNTFTAVPLENVTETRDLFCTALTTLPDGRLLTVGGHDCTGAFLGTPYANVFDPATNKWTFLPDLNDRRWYPTATNLPDGRVLVTAGAATGNTNYDPIPEIYDPVKNTFTKLNAANQVIPDYPHVFVLPNGNILATSSDESKMATYQLNVATQTWTVVDPTVLDATSAVEYLPGKFLKAGGSYQSAPPDNGGGTPSSATAYVLDMTQPSPAWQQVASMANPRTHVVLTLLPDGNVLAAGGSSDIGGVNPANAVYQAEEWSPLTKTWTTLASEKVPRMYHSTSLLLPDGRVAVMGGGHNYFNNIAYPSIEIYSPAYLFKGARPTITSSPATITYGSNFFVGTPDAANIASIALIHEGAVTHSFNMDQNYVPLTFSQTSGGLTVTAPANANLATPGYYMLFMVNKNGVPSVAHFVQIPVPSADTTPPTAPTGLAATVSGGSANLTWTASTDNVGVTNYNVYRSTVSGFTPSAANRIAQPTGTSYTDAGLAAGTYYYLVTAQDAAGNVSTPSNQASATIAAAGIQLIQSNTTGNEASLSQLSLAFPSNVTAGDFLIVTGTAARPSASLTISDSAGDTFTPALGPVSDPNQQDTAYVWYAVNAKGGPDTVTITPSTPDALELHVSEWSGVSKTSPLDQTASATGNGTVVSSGARTPTANNELIFGYAFVGQNASAGAGFTQLTLVNGDMTEYQIQGTAASVAATFTQASDFWLAMMVTFKPGNQNVQPPTAPTNLTATGSTTTASLSWNPSTSSVGVANYNVYRSTTSGFTPSAGNLIGQPTGTSYTDSGLSAGTYYYLVTAQDTAGNVSTPSNQASATVTADTTPPTAPTNLTANGSVSSVSLTWTASTDNVGVTNYTVYRSTVSGFTPSAANRIAQPTGTSYTDAGLAAGTYYYLVTAQDAAGNVSTPSNQASGTVTGDTIPPTAPTNLAATTSISSASLTWTASTDNVGVTNYNVYRSTVSGFTPSLANRIAQPTGTSYTDSGLAPGTYYYLVTAQDAAGNVSSPSNQASATIAAAGIQAVQSNTAGSETSLSRLSVAFPSNVTAGDFLIVTGAASSPGASLTISDSAGDTFVSALGPVNDPNQAVSAYVWYVVNAKGGPNTVTITPSTPDALELHVSEWSGVSNTSPLDQTASATGKGTLVSSGARTPTANGELIFGYAFVGQSATAGAGFTQLTLVNGDMTEYQVQGTAASVAATFTQQSGSWLAMMASFKPANPPAGGGSPPPAPADPTNPGTSTPAPADQLQTSAAPLGLFLIPALPQTAVPPPPMNSGNGTVAAVRPLDDNVAALDQTFAWLGEVDLRLALSMSSSGVDGAANNSLDSADYKGL